MKDLELLEKEIESFVDDLEKDLDAMYESAMADAEADDLDKFLELFEASLDDVMKNNFNPDSIDKEMGTVDNIVGAISDKETEKLYDPTLPVPDIKLTETSIDATYDLLRSAGLLESFVDVLLDLEFGTAMMYETDITDAVFDWYHEQADIEEEIDRIGGEEEEEEEGEGEEVKTEVPTTEPTEVEEEEEEEEEEGPGVDINITVGEGKKADTEECKEATEKKENVEERKEEAVEEKKKEEAKDQEPTQEAAKKDEKDEKEEGKVQESTYTPRSKKLSPIHERALLFLGAVSSHSGLKMFYEYAKKNKE